MSISLTISLAATNVLLRFTTPQAGSYYLLSTSDYLHYRVEASGHFEVPVHVTAAIRKDKPFQFFFVEFSPDP